jgi:ribonucleoside-diphosphate reductase alpha chain
MHFVDKVNRQNPPMYAEHGLAVKGSNLCCEISLHSDPDHSFTCVLSSLNLAFYDDWKDSEVIFYATVFLDCVAEAFLDIAKKTPGMEKVVRFTEKSRALGLGVLGFHTYLQQNMIPFESLQANTFNHLIFREIRDEAERASAWMAEVAGEPEWCRGYGKRNTHLMAIAPTLSTALICGSISQGIEPLLGNVWSQNTAAGNVLRVNPTLIPIMQQRGVYNQETISAIADNGGTVQDVDWLSDHEKLVFKTAFEINQEVIVRLADARAKYVDQGQSVNLFFAADEDEAYISQVHKQAMKSQHLKSLYYMRSRAGVKSSSGKSECIACEG